MIVCAKDALIADLNSISLDTESRRKIAEGNTVCLHDFRRRQFNELWANLRLVLFQSNYTDDIKKSYIYKYYKKIGSKEKVIEELLGKNYDVRYISDSIRNYAEKLLIEYDKDSSSLEEVLLKMIDYHTNQNDINANNTYSFIKNNIIKRILLSYCKDKNANTFSLKNNTYKYVTEFINGKMLPTNEKVDSIMSEMINYLVNKDYNIKGYSFDSILDLYSGVIASKYITNKRNIIMNRNNSYDAKSDKSKSDLKYRIIELINSLNVNNAYKSHLIDMFIKGDYTEIKLQELPKLTNLLNKYEKINRVAEKDIIKAINELSVNNNLKSYLKSCLYDGDYDEIIEFEFEELNQLLEKYEPYLINKRKKEPII